MRKKILIFGDDIEQMRRFGSLLRGSADRHLALLRTASGYQNDRSFADEVYIVRGSQNEEAIRAAYAPLEVGYVPGGDEPSPVEITEPRPAPPPPAMIPESSVRFEMMTNEQLRAYITRHGSDIGVVASPYAKRNALVVQASNLSMMLANSEDSE